MRKITWKWITSWNISWSQRRISMKEINSKTSCSLTSCFIVKILIMKNLSPSLNAFITSQFLYASISAGLAASKCNCLFWFYDIFKPFSLLFCAIHFKFYAIYFKFYVNSICADIQTYLNCRLNSYFRC